MKINVLAIVNDAETMRRRVAAGEDERQRARRLRNVSTRFIVARRDQSSVWKMDNELLFTLGIEVSFIGLVRGWAG